MDAMEKIRIRLHGCAAFGVLPANRFQMYQLAIPRNGNNAAGQLTRRDFTLHGWADAGKPRG